ncbi:ATP-binding cassette domain-containing protein, partial [Roseinatronobacter sp.]|uniref:ATP-binding cassette domain-containing protein n=1 Tax=Roseinatronobacter sp. TaxID=1945755 RepID=UPI0025DA5535
ILTSVGLPAGHTDLFPHEISGGQQRRVGLARILMLNPEVVILDEPTAGLDVSVQATVLRLFRDLRETFDLTYIFISHDLSVVRLMCHRVAVMY